MMSKKRLKNGIAMLIIYALAYYVVQTENSVYHDKSKATHEKPANVQTTPAAKLSTKKERSNSNKLSLTTKQKSDFSSSKKHNTNNSNHTKNTNNNILPKAGIKRQYYSDVDITPKIKKKTIKASTTPRPRTSKKNKNTRIPPTKRESDKSIGVIDNSTLTSDWNSYRLGDVVLSNYDVGTNYEKHYPGSIAAEYLHLINLTYGRNRREYHKVKFCNIVRQRRNPRKSSNSRDFVVHLRLGDVLDNNIQPDEIEDVFHYGVSIVPLQIRNMINRNNTLGWWHYVKSKCYYSTVLAQLPPNTINRVVIVGSAIHNKEKPTNNNSVMYRGLVQQFFEAEGYSVSLRPDAPPDDNIIYISHAFTFVASGGGFSTLAHDCVNYFGGTTFPKSTGWTGGLDEVCGKTPRPTSEMRNYSWEQIGWHGRGPWDGNKTYPTGRY